MDTNEPAMRPSEVSQRVVEQHHGLQARLGELSRVAKTLATGGPAALTHALSLTRALYNELQMHIRFERAMLVPALREADAWGPLRANHLMARLRVRRNQLRDLRESFTSPEVGTLGATLDKFVTRRRADMAASERQINTLRDDVHGIDVEGG